MRDLNTGDEAVHTATADTEFVAFQRELAGEYSLERELGRGGMGIVYLARDVQLDRQVAIKVLPTSLATRTELREVAWALAYAHGRGVVHRDVKPDNIPAVMRQGSGGRVQGSRTVDEADVIPAQAGMTVLRRSS